MATKYKCDFCKDTGLYDACCRPHECDCGQYKPWTPSKLALQVEAAFKQSASTAVTTSIARGFPVVGIDPEDDKLMDEFVAEGRRPLVSSPIEPIIYVAIKYELHEDKELVYAGLSQKAANEAGDLAVANKDPSRYWYEIEEWQNGSKL